LLVGILFVTILRQIIENKRIEKIRNKK